MINVILDFFQKTKNVYINIKYEINLIDKT